MSDDVLSVIPTDPEWQPDRASAGRATALAAHLAMEPATDPAADGTQLLDLDIDVTWHDTVTFVDCGSNLERIGCPHCGAVLDLDTWHDLLDAAGDEDGGFPTLTVVVPCCAGTTSLDALDYDWPCGFARFEIALWNPERAWLDDADLAAVATALGHPVRQIRAHI
ncbi:hypothetical protein [Streptomyces mangrovisoli]|uniref:Uncharacterized protein n=1 Tax=Streptomyces mangrovisoli TaxID=1428628 RepID=A0A1J4NSF4_9ACTN|nr:hypothetical protein [Streptomyces mangrovisoli]OIJ65409.1 hypothetical protein WN71_024400 [Streptomyces mangrovisoli]